MSSKFQKGISFKSIQDFLDYLPEGELKIVEKLRKIILGCIPNGKEKLSYNVPFYYQHKRVLYIWPSSIPWGGIKKTGTVSLGFCKGQQLTDELGILNKADRKEIASINFKSTKEIDADVLRSYIFEALFIDEQNALTKI